MDSEKVTRYIFYPRYTEKPSETDVRKILEFNTYDDITLGGLFFIRDRDLPTILLFHGNGETAVDYIFFAEHYLAAGANLAVVDYRGYGFSFGDPKFSALFEDAYAVYGQMLDYLSDKGFVPEIILFGRSLGSVCASVLGANGKPRPIGVVFESAFCNLYELMRELMPTVARKVDRLAVNPWSNHTFISKIRSPVLIIHGTMDILIHPGHADCIYDALPGDIYKRKVMIEGAGHNTILSYKRKYFGALADFIKEVTRDK